MTTDLNYAVEALLKPLTYIKVPVDIFAMLLSLTLRYIPTLLIETEKIMKAQASRGVDFNESSLKEKIVQVISLLIPVFVISFNRSEDLANAMEVKGYVIGEKRTKIDQYRMGFSDYFTLSISLIILGAMIYLKVVL
jgi:energy-coupling factor transport system permease protein